MKQHEVALLQKEALYRYEAKLVRVLDGDSFELVIDVGFNWTNQEMIRLYGVDTPELRGPTREAGLLAKSFTESWLADSVLYITSRVFRPYDSFGRVLATVYREGDSVPLNDALVKAGHAVEFLP